MVRALIVRHGQAHPAQLPAWEELLLPEEEPLGWSPEPRVLWGSSDEGRQAETIWPAIQGIRRVLPARGARAVL